MRYLFEICSMVSWVEQHIKEKHDFGELEGITGFSYRHLREVFREVTGVSLSRYISARRIANAAFDIVNSSLCLTQIAYTYAYDSYDTFTRAFTREAGMTPSAFKKARYRCARKLICMGVYAPIILGIDRPTALSAIPFEPKTAGQAPDGCTLYGVPRIFYSRTDGEGTQYTPFAMCLQSILNYLGQDISYTLLMAASGAAFRLRWNLKGWDFAAVDLRNIHENHLRAFELAFQAAGRACMILEKRDHGKDDFVGLIVTELDRGRPLIALGVVGPPEACILSGYRENGEILLGWSCFQDNAEYAGSIAAHASGAFVCGDWWDTIEAVIAVGEQTGTFLSEKEVLENALTVMVTEKTQIREGNGEVYLGGQAAYTAWARAMTNEGSSSGNAMLPLLFERMMCLGDLFAMVCEGRTYAARYFRWLAKTYPAIAERCAVCAEHFEAIVSCFEKMLHSCGIAEGGEETARRIADPATRTCIVPCILEAQKYEAAACDVLREIIDRI